MAYKKFISVMALLAIFLLGEGVHIDPAKF
jgi:hypothetical protein